MFKVMSRPCDQCLLTPERIVSGRRAAEIIRQTRAQNCHFVCHKSPKGRNNEIACRAHHDLGIGQMSRIAGRMGWIEEIDPETLLPVGAS